MIDEGRQAAIERVRAHFDNGGFLADLRRRVAIPSESQDPSRRDDLYRYLAEEIAPSLTAMGFESRIFDNPDERGGPLLVGTRHEGEGLPTLLTYGHGDVVRGIREQWREGLDPWTITIEGNRWYGRGTADNKGQHSIIMAALATLIEQRKRLGFNVKILIETSEEIGSPGLDEFCAQHRDLLAADVLIASDGPRIKPDTADVKLGNRGGIAFDLQVNLRKGSLHSGHYGGLLEDPGITLAHALSTITTPRGKILVEEWLPKSVPARVTESLRKAVIDPGDPTLAIPEDWGEPGLNRAEKVYGWTSFIVLAFLTGRPEAPVNGVQPDARAHCQIRYTADVDADRFLPALREHLDRHGFPQVEIIPATRNFFKAWRTDPDDPWVDFCLQSLERTLGRPANLMPNSSGSLPSEVFARNLDLPVIWIPHSYGGCKQHGPDEHILASATREALGIMTGLFHDLGTTPPIVD
ncbi:MAG: M20 family metallopeptidase [Geminicoccaceae bacterium]|nr:M20 family metallopeptidase [Geminicoccaceae bacterium]